MKYNQRKYNDQRYNINGIVHFTTLPETMTEVDGTQLADLDKALAEAMMMAEATALFSMSQVLMDFLFMDTGVQIQFTNKALTDTVRLAEWFSIERSPAENGWYD